MPILKAAKKALRQSPKKREANELRTRAMKESLKEVRKAITAKDVKAAQALVPKVQAALDKAAKRGVIKKNAASRKKSRVVAAIKKLA